MIFTRLQARHFRSLKYVDQTLAPFQALVGPNASGKTTFLDVFNLLKDLMERQGNVVEAVGLRGADFSKLLRKGEGSSFQVALEAMIPSDIRERMGPNRQGSDHVRYELEIGFDRASNQIGLDRETLWIFTKPQGVQYTIFDTFPHLVRDVDSITWEKRRGRSYILNKTPGGNDNFYPDNPRKYKPSIRLGRARSTLAHVPPVATDFEVALWFKDRLEHGVQEFVLDSQKIRQPSPPGLGNGFQTDGSNLPWVIEELHNREPKQFAKWLDHVRTALEDIEDVRTFERPEDHHRYLIVDYCNNLSVPSWLVSGSRSQGFVIVRWLGMLKSW